MNNATAGFCLVVAALTTGPAFALSCDRLGAVETYRFMTGGEDSYILVLGSFGELRPAISDPGWTTRWTGQFTGFSASALGFDQPFEAEVTLQYFFLPSGTKPAAVAGSMQGKVGLFWIKASEAGYVTDYNPCIPNPEADPARMDQYLDCINGRDCEPRE